MNEIGIRDAAVMESVVVVRLPRELREALHIRAMREDRTMASLLRVAARSYLAGAETHEAGCSFEGRLP